MCDWNEQLADYAGAIVEWVLWVCQVLPINQYDA